MRLSSRGNSERRWESTKQSVSGNFRGGKGYRAMKHLRNKFYRQGSAISWACSNCAHDEETIMYALVHFPSIVDLWVCVEQLLSSGKTDGFVSESIMKIVSPLSFDWERQSFFFTLIAVAKDVSRWAHFKRLIINTFLFRRLLIYFPNFTW